RRRSAAGSVRANGAGPRQRVFSARRCVETRSDCVCAYITTHSRDLKAGGGATREHRPGRRHRWRCSCLLFRQMSVNIAESRRTLPSNELQVLYDAHLLFDNVVDRAAVGPRQRYEALARSVRDLLSQQWVRTEQTYERENPKRVYYLSMEFLSGRSLTNNIANLMVSPLISDATRLATRDWLALLEEEPDAGLGNGGLGRLAACFLDSMATMQLPAMGYGLHYEYGM